MKTITFIALASLFFLTTTAQAKWECTGPEYVCGPTVVMPKASTKQYNAASKQHKVASKQHKSAKIVKAKQQTKVARTVYPKKEKNIISDIVDGVSGLASFYWQPQAIACGPGRFNPNALTAASKTLPCGSKVKVTNKHNGKSVVVTINDRGPYVKGRIIDLSRAAAQQISMTDAGVVPVKVARLN